MTPIKKVFNSTTWQFTGGAPSELFAFAGQELASGSGFQSRLAGVDISKGNTGAFYLTLYFSPSPTTT